MVSYSVKLSLLLGAIVCIGHTTISTASRAPRPESSAQARIGPRRYPGRIVGGDAVSADSWDGRWICSLVDLYYGDTHSCGVNVLWVRGWMVTAGHCVYPYSPEDYRVHCGCVLWQDRSCATYQGRRVKKILRHQAFNPNNLFNDIALIQLDEHLNDTKRTKYAIPPQWEVQTGNTYTVYGWGATEENGAASPDLRSVNVNAVPFQTCSDSYSREGYTVDNATMFCAASSGRDACQGDSGGACMEKNMLMGLVSWGIGCAKPEYPGVYTRVSAYLSWIDETIKANQQQ